MKQRAETGRKRKAVFVTILVLAVLGSGAWAGWEFYVKPNLPSSSPTLSVPPPPGVGSRAPATGPARATTPLPQVREERPATRSTKLGPEERRLVDSNVLGFFGSASSAGLIVRLEFKEPVNLAGIREARLLEARDESGRAIGALGDASAEIRTSDDPTGAMSLRLFVRGSDAAQASSVLRALVLQLGPATIRAKYDKGLFSQ